MFGYIPGSQYFITGDLLLALKKAGGYYNLEEGEELVSTGNYYVAELHQGKTNRGAFILHEKRLQCLRPFYYDEVLEAPVCTLQTFNVALAYELESLEKRIELFNRRAQEVVALANEKGYDVGDPYEITNVQRYRK